MEYDFYFYPHSKRVHLLEYYRLNVRPHVLEYLIGPAKGDDVIIF